MIIYTIPNLYQHSPQLIMRIAESEICEDIHILTYDFLVSNTQSVAKNIKAHAFSDRKNVCHIEKNYELLI